MTDVRLDDARFERQLRAALAELAPEAAPAALREAVMAAPRGGGRHAKRRGRALLAVVGLAAGIIVAVGVVGFVTRPRPVLPADGAVPPVGVPSPAPSPSPGMVMFSFRVLTPDGSMASKAQVQRVADVMAARIVASGIHTFGSQMSDDRITFDLPLPQADPASIDSMRKLLSATGAISISLVGADAVSPGDRIDGEPLMTGDAVTDAESGVDQGGSPTLDLTFDARTATTLADTTRAHVGEYLAIALDGVAIAVPVINEAIPNGRIQITFPSDDRTPQRLAAIVQAGLAVGRAGPDRATLPLPVEVLTP